ACLCIVHSLWRGPASITKAAQLLREAVARLTRCFGIDPGLGDRLVPESLAVTRRQLCGIETEVADGVLVPAHLLERRRQGAPGNPFRHGRSVAVHNPTANEDVEQPEKVSLAGAAAF